MARTALIAGAAVVLLAGAGTGALYMHQAKVVARAEQSKSSAKVAFIDVREITLRLADAASEHYIKLRPVLAVRQAKAEDVQDRIPVARDRIMMIVTARSSTELATPEGTTKLKKDLMAELRQDFHDDIIDIYFSGYLVE